MKALLFVVILSITASAEAQQTELQGCVANTFLKMDSLQKEGKDVFNEWHDCMKGKALPGFSVKTLDGQVVDSNTIMGKVTVLYSFSLYCHPCYESIPAMNKLVAEYRAKGVEFLCLIPGNLKSTEAELLSKYRLDFPKVADAKEVIETMGVVIPKRS